MFRSVAEGILFNVYQCYRILTECSGIPKNIILSGGILHSKAWTQMVADIFQRELILSPNPHASLIGGAALGLYAAGAIKHPEDFSFQKAACDSVGFLDRQTVVRPRPEFFKLYEKKFERYIEQYIGQRVEVEP